MATLSNANSPLIYPPCPHAIYQGQACLLHCATGYAALGAKRGTTRYRRGSAERAQPGYVVLGQRMDCWGSGGFRWRAGNSDSARTQAGQSGIRRRQQKMIHTAVVEKLSCLNSVQYAFSRSSLLIASFRGTWGVLIPEPRAFQCLSCPAPFPPTPLELHCLHRLVAIAFFRRSSNLVVTVRTVTVAASWYVLSAAPPEPSPPSYRDPACTARCLALGVRGTGPSTV